MQPFLRLLLLDCLRTLCGLVAEHLQEFVAAFGTFLWGLGTSLPWILKEGVGVK